MAHYLQLIIVTTLFLACISTAHCREHSAPRGEREATGEADESSTLATDLKETLRTVCKNTQTIFTHDSFPLRLQGEEGDNRLEPRWRTARYSGLFNKKPVATHPNSFCTGVNSTCCTLSNEKTIVEVSTRDYLEVYHSVLASEYYQNCPSVGRESYHSVRRSLREVKHLLSIGINDALGTTLQNTQSLDNLLNYLTQFTIIPDLCPLRWNVRQVVEDITLTNVISGFLDHEEDSVTHVYLESIESSQMDCLRNITSPYIADFTDEITATLQRFLVDYKVYVESLNLLREVITIIKNHHFSESCSAALMRLRHCAWCGGITVFPPCVDFCLNTLRGCLADVAELHDDFKELVMAVNSLSIKIDSLLKPEALLENQLNRFITMIPEVRQESSLQYLANTECSSIGNEEDSTTDSSAPHDRSRRSRFTQTTNEEQSGTSFNPNVDVSENSVTKAFSNERNCLERFEELMLNIPQEMCYLTKARAITTALNTQCWTGTDIGEYKDPLVGPYKHQQWNNTAFATAPLETYILFEPLMYRMRLMTTEVNQVLDFRTQCVDSDDEDCIRLVDFECENIGSGSGSGSGSDSGSGFTPGYSDLEQTKPTTGINGPTEKVPYDQNDPNSEEFSRYNDQGGGGDSSKEDPPTESALGTLGMFEITRTNSIPTVTTHMKPEIAVTVESEGTVGVQTTLAETDSPTTTTTSATDSLATTTQLETQETDTEPIHTEQQTASRATGTEFEVTGRVSTTTKASSSTQDDSSAAVSIVWSVVTVTVLAVLSVFMQ